VKKKNNSAVAITDPSKQQLIYKNLIGLLDQNTINARLDDSLAILILPIQASCPACRMKVIDSIMKYKNSLANRHFIVISSNSGRKNINAYFREQQHELPVLKGRLFLDTMNVAYELDLYDEKPTFYYAFNKKVYKAVASSPYTIKQDLNEFFSSSSNSSTN
jgi:hypothetical protein